MELIFRAVFVVCVFKFTIGSNETSDICSESGRFGPGCKYQCHCRNVSACDQTYGYCENGGCESGFAGAACQYADLAYNQSTTGDLELEFGETSLAVDGDNNTCFVAGRQLNSVWSVELQELSRVHTISVQIVKTSASAQDLEVTVHGKDDNSEDDDDGIVATPSASRSEDMRLYYHLPHPAKASRVQIRTVGNDTSLSLCDVNVFGDCQVEDHYKWLCDTKCGCERPDETCDRLWGTCSVFGCRAGWTGNKCQQACSHGSYGFNCSGRCSVRCFRSSCDATSGECTTCVVGRTGKYCEDHTDAVILAVTVACAIVGVFALLVFSLIMVAMMSRCGKAKGSRTAPEGDADYVIADEVEADDDVERCLCFGPSRRGSLDFHH